MSVCGFFNIEDLFAAGIGFDIGGACLVALGLLTSPRQIADFMDLHRGGNAYLGLAAIDDKINGESGVFFLVFGFLLQAAGYVLTAALSLRKASGASGVAGVIATLVLAFLATAVGARIWRQKRRRRVIIGVSRYDQNPRLRTPLPLEFRLKSFAQAKGEEDFSGWYPEQLERYRRLFGVDDFYAGPGTPYYQKATELQAVESSADAPTYDATQIGDGVEDTGGLKLLRRIFG